MTMAAAVVMIIGVRGEWGEEILSVENALDLHPDTTTRQRIASTMYNNIRSIKSEFGVSGECRIY
jgi:hypothetical protein